MLGSARFEAQVIFIHTSSVAPPRNTTSCAATAPATAVLLLLYCFNSTATVVLLQLYCYHCTASTVLLLLYGSCYFMGHWQQTIVKQ